MTIPTATSSSNPTDAGSNRADGTSGATDWIECLRDGTQVLIRPIAASDSALERNFIAGLSAQSTRYRFLGAIGIPSDQLVERLTQLGSLEVAFIALIGDEGKQIEIGVCRYSPSADGLSCECAVTVADPWQNKGLATLLMKHLIDVARDRGIERMDSMDAGDNYAMDDLAAHLGFTKKTDPGDVRQVIHSLDLTSVSVVPREK